VRRRRADTDLEELEDADHRLGLLEVALTVASFSTRRSPASTTARKRTRPMKSKSGPGAFVAFVCGPSHPVGAREDPSRFRQGTRVS
jgi:hypothetical protein